MAFKSNREGRQGKKIKSAYLDAMAAALSECGAVSMITKSAPPASAFLLITR